MNQCISVGLLKESDPMNIVAKYIKSLHQSMALMIPCVSSRFVVDPEPASIVTQVLVLVFFLLLQNCPPPFRARVNSHDNMPGTITNVYSLKRRSILESLLQDCHSFLFLSLQLKLNVLLQDLELRASNYSILRDPYSVVCAKH